jgi:hypothetical protein
MPKGEAAMYDRTDEADAVIAVAGEYFKAMVDADEAELRRVFHPGRQDRGQAV